ncbi:organic cation transporter protein-like isoform X2 [Acropora muricata]|uniref:organic cation transporter protein-like isoform X2 n=1 Tax=Acropora muricata TaxID=159855 RepID=UPI0034E4A9CE
MGWIHTGKMSNSGKNDNFDFDGVFEHVSSFGRFQRILFFGLNTILVFTVTCQFSLLVFAFGNPGFHCVTPNVTCDAKKCCGDCKAYEFNGPFHSTVSEWNLICDRKFLGATIQSCFFVGMLIGSLVTGMFSDAWGRKKCIFVSNAIMLLSGVVSSFVHNIPLFAFLRFLSGFGLSGVLLSHYIYSMELVGPSIRTAAGNISYFFYNGYQILLVLIAYYVRSWRTLLLITMAPAVLVYPFWKFIPESARWLIARGHLDEAQTVLESYGGKNKSAIDSQALRAVIEKIRGAQLAKEQNSKKHSLIDLLRTPKLRKWTLIICYQWFVVSLVNFGIFIFISGLKGNLYLKFALMEVFTTARIPVTWFLYLKFGRRICHGIIMISVGLSFCLVLATYKAALSIFGYVLIDCTWTSVYLMTAEIFPTVLRNTGQGMGSTSSRVGGILAPYIALMGQLPGLSITFPVVIFASVALLAGISMYWMPETLFAPMHQTTEEAEAAEEDFGIPYCGRRRTAETAGCEDEVEMENAKAL